MCTSSKRRWCWTRRTLALRRELAYLLLQLHRDEEATKEFEVIARADPGDRIAVAQLAALLAPKAGKPPVQFAANKPGANGSPDPNSSDKVTNPKAMAQKSLAAGYIKDAIRYYHQANEHNPDDAEVAIGLGWAYNIAGDNREAIHWFDRARHMNNAAVARDADRAYHNLTSGGVPEITIWGLPIYSTRWQDMFAYSQVKLSIPVLGKAPVQFYLSTRLVGDALSAMPGGEGCAAEVPVGERRHIRRWGCNTNLASLDGMGGGRRSGQLLDPGARGTSRHSRLPGRCELCERVRRAC